MTIEQYFPVLFSHRTPCHSKYLCRPLNNILVCEAKKEVNLRKVRLIINITQGYESDILFHCTYL